MLVWASKDQQDADLDSPWLKFIYEKPAWVPSLETLIFQGCTWKSWHQNPACDQGRGTWGSWDPEDSGGEDALLWGEAHRLSLGALARQSRTEGPHDACGSSSVYWGGCKKGYTWCSLHGNIDHSRLWNPDWVTSSGRKPPPLSLSGVQPNLWKQTRGPSIVITMPAFLFWPVVP